MVVIDGAEEAARLALDQAIAAADAGTFGVGAVLVHDASGKVLDVAANDVVREIAEARVTGKDGDVSLEPTYATHDPTAHGERQLISRYFERVNAGERLPSPSELTIVSSLEPCAMCSGAILASGLKVGVVALDPMAGLGLAGGRNFRRLPKEIRDKAKSSFAYYEIPGVRPFLGSSQVAFGANRKTRSVAKKVLKLSEQTFLGSLDRVRTVVSEGGESAPREDPSDLSPKGPLRSLLEERLPHFLSLRLDNHRQPSQKLLDLLEAVSEQGKGERSAAALVDRFGNLLITSGGGAHGDPVATGFAELVRTYSQVRFELMTDPNLSLDAGKHLAHPRFGTLYRYPVPDPESPLTLLDLGIYGSTLEGPLPPDNRPNLQFVTRKVVRTPGLPQLQALVQSMPPFYAEELDLGFKTTCL